MVGLAWVGEDRAGVLDLKADGPGGRCGEERDLARERGEERARRVARAERGVALPGQGAEAADLVGPELVAGGDELVPLAARLGEAGQMDGVDLVEDVHRDEPAVQLGEGYGWWVRLGFTLD